MAHSGITEVHPEFRYSWKRWERNRDAVGGNDEVKGKGYLRKLQPEDADRQKEYEEGAYFIEIPGYTVASLTGMVFQQPATVELPEAMEDFRTNADGAGQSLEQLAKAALQELFTVGRYGILVDFPVVGEEMDSATEGELGLRPTMATYPAEYIDNWYEETINGREVVTMVKLREYWQYPKHEFDHNTELVYRVLRLRKRENGAGYVYTQEVIYHTGDPIIDEYVPKAQRQELDHIPFYFMGAQNNKPNVDRAPVSGICDVALSQYRNIADDEESAFLTGQPTLHINIGDTDTEFWKSENPSGVQLGSRRGFVTQNGSAELIQMDTATRPGELKAEKVTEMVHIGARIIRESARQQTAEAARIEAGGQASQLDTAVGNCSEAFRAALGDMALFAGANPEEITFELNDQYWINTMDPQTASAVIMLGDAGLAASSDQLHMLKQGRIEYPEGRSLEDIREERASQPLT